MSDAIVHLGGNDIEAVYLHDAEFVLPSGKQVRVRRSDFPDHDMAQVIARHLARYCQVAVYCRPGYRVLDFPCGSGYSSELFRRFEVIYEGLDWDADLDRADAKIEYLTRFYGSPTVSFRIGNLCNTDLPEALYDVIGCIEGLEHIELRYQPPLIAAFYRALKPSGWLIVSSPENMTGVSGPAVDNKFHPGELTKNDFLALLTSQFGNENVYLHPYKDVLSSGAARRTAWFGICEKP